MVTIQDKLDIILNSPHAIPARSIPAVMLIGEPGAGKTYAAEEFGNRHKYSVLFYQCTEGTNAEAFIYGINAPALADAISVRGDSTGKDALIQGIFWKAIALSHTQDVLIVIDEYDKSTPQTDALFLDFLNSGRISHPMFTSYKNKLAYVDGMSIVGNPNKIRVVLTSNYEREFLEPLSRRIVTVEVLFPQEQEMLGILRANLRDDKITDEAIKVMIDFIYEWRRLHKAGHIQHTLVQNEIARVCSILLHQHQTGNTVWSELTSVMEMLVSKNAKDVEQFNTYSKNKLSYYVGQFISKCTLVKAPR